jgi:hypothetical protein
MNQREYAKHAGLTQPRICQLLKTGKFEDAAVKTGGRWNIDPKKADKVLKQNISPSKKRQGEFGARKTRGKRKPKRRSRRKPEATPEEKKRVTEEAGTEDLTLFEAELLERQYRAAKQKLEYRKASGELVEAKDVQKAAFDKGRMLRDGLLNLKSKISPLLAIEANATEIDKLLDREFRQILGELSS